VVGTNFESEEDQVPQCLTGGCSRETWNGQRGEHCCRTCEKNHGKAHGSGCDLSREKRNLNHKGTTSYIWEGADTFCFTGAGSEAKEFRERFDAWVTGALTAELNGTAEQVEAVERRASRYAQGVCERSQRTWMDFGPTIKSTVCASCAKSIANKGCRGCRKTFCHPCFQRHRGTSANVTWRYDDAGLVKALANMNSMRYSAMLSVDDAINQMVVEQSSAESSGKVRPIHLYIWVIQNKKEKEEQEHKCSSPQEARIWLEEFRDSDRLLAETNVSSGLLSLDDFVLDVSTSHESDMKKVLRRVMTAVDENGESSLEPDDTPETPKAFPFERTSERLWCRENIGSSGDAGIEELTREMEAGHMTELEVLELQWNQISAVGLIDLARALSKGVLPKLRTLQLSGNDVGDAGLEALARVVEEGHLEKLEVLDLESNKISGVGLHALEQALRKDVSPALCSLNVRGNEFDQNSKVAMLEVVKKRSTLRMCL